MKAAWNVKYLEGLRTKILAEHVVNDKYNGNQFVKISNKKLKKNLQVKKPCKSPNLKLTFVTKILKLSCSFQLFQKKS